MEKALNAKLRKERIYIFKQFLSDYKRQQMMMNSLCVSAHIPRIALTSKQAALQSDNLNRAAEKSRKIREDVA